MLFYLTASLALVGAEAKQTPLMEEKRTYKTGDVIPVTCLNRTIESGEHITDAQGQLQYIPFPICNETGRPLELQFGVEKDINCTLPFISDPLYHLLEFYIHNDAPLTCRIPRHPLPYTSLTPPSLSNEDLVGALGTQSTLYIPFIIALTGTLQLSHLHIANALNVLLHTSPKELAPGTIDAATAYSISTVTRSERIVIGDPLALRLSVRWYHSPTLPPGWQGVGGHLFLSTLAYCALSAGAATAVCFAWFRGVEFPRRLRRYGRDRTFGNGGAYGFGGAAGGVGNGWGVGKRD
ncbi:hypothetical protein M501DRAFT_940744 [Patellaria atrata CBS 101060]|uniref:Uncharacterized protein n=1 Tax=Patellaria atrata CBS 101060 TaxID=1346257 RepID=A0A9P4S4N2_9PEZI|nr:hypothetical protein M501DRAFT_940744 [Patellaria atrata CBS 101060]